MATTSETKTETNLVDRLTNTVHYKTDIKENGKTVASREASTPKESERRANESYEDYKGRKK